MTIQLNDIQFYGYHGLYEAEQKMGNNFIVNLSIAFTPTVSKVTNIQETIDYVNVYTLLSHCMQTPTPLLETLVEEIATAIFDKFEIAEKVFVQITKEKVFVSTLHGNMSVSITKTR